MYVEHVALGPAGTISPGHSQQFPRTPITFVRSPEEMKMPARRSAYRTFASAPIPDSTEEFRHFAVPLLRRDHHMKHARSLATSIVRYRSRAAHHGETWCRMVLLSTPGARHPGVSSCCQSDTTTRTPPATLGYVGLRRIAATPLTAAQNATICTDRRAFMVPPGHQHCPGIGEITEQTTAASAARHAPWTLRSIAHP